MVRDEHTPSGPPRQRTPGITAVIGRHLPRETTPDGDPPNLGGALVPVRGTTVPRVFAFFGGTLVGAVAWAVEPDGRA